VWPGVYMTSRLRPSIITLSPSATRIDTTSALLCSPMMVMHWVRSRKVVSDWKKRLIAYEAKHVAQRTDRSAALAARASYDLAQEAYERYTAAKLTLPLKQSLAEKKKHMQEATTAFEQVAAYGVSEYLTASTFQIATMYQTMAKDLINSERPKDLDELQNEQYGILLEEQAFIFEEQAMEVFRINLARGSDGIYDSWIKQTYEVLAQMNPAEYQRQFKRVEYAADIY